MLESQNYRNFEHIINDDECENIGKKRNACCLRASGNIIIHLDDDDIYASDWIEKSVRSLIEKQADIVGLNVLNFYDKINECGYQYSYTLNMRPWVAGATLCYWKDFWKINPFYEIQISEDTTFTNRTKNIWAHNHINSFLASIHEFNTSRRNVGDSRCYRRCSEEENEEIRRRFFGSRG